MKFNKRTQLLVLLCLTLGLAPFAPEPHIWDKLKWLIGGAAGMQTMDWFDIVLHGTPWLLLIGDLLYQLFKKIKDINSNKKGSSK